MHNSALGREQLSEGENTLGTGDIITTRTGDGHSDREGERLESSLGTDRQS